MSIRSLVKNSLPPPVLNQLKKLLGRPSSPGPRIGREQDPDYYDRAFETDESWRKHYTESPYYMIWTVILDRLRRLEASRVLEIGCGSGQLACAIRDAGIAKEYLGFDFSSKRLEQARSVCPEFHFVVADAFKTDLIESTEYDTVVTTEFLEHVEGDLEVIERIRLGARILATVPNFPYISHVRHFKSPEEVIARYGRFLDNLSVISILGNQKGKAFFLLEGVRK